MEEEEGGLALFGPRPNKWEKKRKQEKKKKVEEEWNGQRGNCGQQTTTFLFTASDKNVSTHSQVFFSGRKKKRNLSLPPLKRKKKEIRVLSR
jgi:hypothetical protein